MQSVGIWEKIRRVLSVDPNRSNGVPLNPHFRNPPPGALEPNSYDDPVTTPAGDIADNPYWKRDARRNYPRPSVLAQADAVGLLTMGSAAAPKKELVGEAGQKELIAARSEGNKGLAAFFTQNGVAKDDILNDGLPPLPSGQNMNNIGNWEVYKYKLAEKNAYPEK